jgi:hypothetical protein
MYQQKRSRKIIAGTRLIMGAALALALQQGAQAAQEILASQVLGGNCSATVTLQSGSGSFGPLTYTFVGNGGTSTVVGVPQSGSSNPLIFQLPGGSYTLYITVGPYPSTTSSPGYIVNVAPCPLSNTGAGDHCTSLAPGNADPHWQLATPYPSAYSGPPVVADPGSYGPVYTTAPYPGWLPTKPNTSTWITPSPLGATYEQYGGQYVYRTTFSATLGTAGAATSGYYSSDNYVVGVYLNGVLVPSFPTSTNAKSFTEWTHFLITGLAAINTLDFVVENLGAGGQPIPADDSTQTPTGLVVQFTDYPTSGGGTCQHTLPQFVFGGGWYSALYFTNPTDFSVSFPVSFLTDAGTPMTVPSAGGSSTTVTLAPQATTLIEAPNSGELNQGYVTTQLPIGVTGYGLFRGSSPGIADQEAVVPLSDTGTSTATLTWDDTNYITGVAIANPTSNTETVAITAWNSAGTLIGTSSVTLPPNGHTAAALRSLPGLAGVAGNLGSATFSVPSGTSQAISVLGLRFNGPAFTSIPVTAQ